MTAIVKKGAGRPAAAAKSNKHAQRTALPPKKGSPGAEAIAEAKADKAKGYGQMTVAELRTAAKMAGVTGYSRMAKGALLTAILEWERAAVAVADRPVTFPESSALDVALDEAFGEEDEDSANKLEYSGDCADCSTPIDVWISDGGDYRVKTNAGSDVEHECFPVVEQAEVEEIPSIPPTGLDTLSNEGKKSLSKAASFLEEAVRRGWEATKQGTQDPAHYGVTVARGTERIEIEWVGGVFQGDTCYYSHSARQPIKLRNASHAKKVMAIPAAQADEEAKKVTAHKAARPGRKSQAESTTERRKALPFDVETATDEEILAAVQNRNVAWTNEISGAVEDAYVTAGLRIQTMKSGRGITFVSATGFRTVRVSSIVSVR